MSGTGPEFPSQKHHLRRIQFGVFEVDLDSGELRKFGTRVRLQLQPFELLIALLEKPGQVVTREELKARLWPEDVYVSFDQSLNRSINKLRLVLGDQADNPRFIETIPRRGYRFIAPVILSAPPLETPKPEDGKGPSGECHSALDEVTSPVIAEEKLHRDVVLGEEIARLRDRADESAVPSPAKTTENSLFGRGVILSAIIVVFVVIAGVLTVRHHAQTVNHWSNPEAYNLYLRSLSFAHDGLPNQQAIELLQQSVGAEPTSAVGWYELGPSRTRARAESPIRRIERDILESRGWKMAQPT